MRARNGGCSVRRPKMKPLFPQAHPPLRALLVALSCEAGALALGCAAGETGFTSGGADGAPTDDAEISVVFDDASWPPPAAASTSNDDAGAIAAPAEDASLGDDTGAPSGVLPPGPPFDAGEGGTCVQPLAAGSLAIVELMIESTAGTGDHGEWIEVASTLDCAIRLDGLSGTCPTGAKVNTFTITGNVWIPPRGTFVVSDSSNIAVNHGLPGLVIPWSGQPGDVLRNEGATVTLVMNGVVIDSVTYSKIKLTPGVSIAFPKDCPPNVRSQWPNWQGSTFSWFPAFLGTPNAPNEDVHCPPQADE
jgi:hypothetical protein